MGSSPNNQGNNLQLTKPYSIKIDCHKVIPASLNFLRPYEDQNGHTYPLVALSDTVLHTSYSHCTLKMQIKRITIFIFRINYIGTLKTVFSNKAFVIMFFVLGGNMSFISTLATKMEQIMCRYDV